MPAITDPTPADVAAELDVLRTRLDETIPARAVDKNLLVATWNLRAFGDLTEKWHSAAGDSPKRDLFALACIAEIVSRFDVIAIQKVRGNIKSLRHLLKALGDDWGVILTDVTKGSEGNDERLAFVFDTRRVTPSGLAAELVVPIEHDPARIKPGAMTRQFARTPYAVSFRAGCDTFILVTLHVLYGDDAADREPELRAIADWLASWAKRENDWNHNLITLGDFNIDRKGDPRYEAFTSTGLAPPAELEALPRTIFDDGNEHFYDQIAWFTDARGIPELTMAYTGNAGTFLFPDVVMTALTAQELSWRISDHYPLWAEFELRRARS